MPVRDYGHKWLEVPEYYHPFLLAQAVEMDKPAYDGKSDQEAVLRMVLLTIYGVTQVSQPSPKEKARAYNVFPEVYALSSAHKTSYVMRLHEGFDGKFVIPTWPKLTLEVQEKLQEARQESPGKIIPRALQDFISAGTTRVPFRELSAEEAALVERDIYSQNKAPLLDEFSRPVDMPSFDERIHTMTTQPIYTYRDLAPARHMPMPPLRGNDNG